MCLNMDKEMQIEKEHEQDDTHIAREELDRHAQNERKPEYVQTLKHQQKPVKEVITKEGRIDGYRIDPCTVHNPGRETEDTKYNYETELIALK